MVTANVGNKSRNVGRRASRSQILMSFEQALANPDTLELSRDNPQAGDRSPLPSIEASPSSPILVSSKHRHRNGEGILSSMSAAGGVGTSEASPGGRTTAEGTVRTVQRKGRSHATDDRRTSSLQESSLLEGSFRIGSLLEDSSSVVGLPLESLPSGSRINHHNHTVPPSVPAQLSLRSPSTDKSDHFNRLKSATESGKLTASSKKTADDQANRVWTHHFLIVDDTPSNRRMLQMVLNNRNIHCDMAVNGKQAVDMVQEHGDRYDFIFMVNNNNYKEFVFLSSLILSHPLSYSLILSHSYCRKQTLLMLHYCLTVVNSLLFFIFFVLSLQRSMNGQILTLYHHNNTNLN